jgi:hypothetical protein
MAKLWRNGIIVEMTDEEIEAERNYTAALATEVDYKAAIVAMMDAKAKERRYDSALSISTYVGSTNAMWAAEAEAFVTWRDAVWTYCYEQLVLVGAQARSQPTVAEFLAELPAMVWPV